MASDPITSCQICGETVTDFIFLGSKSLQMVTELSWNFLPYYLFNYLLLCFSSPVLDSVQFSSVVQSCPTLWDPMDYSIRPPCPSPTPRVYSNSSPLSLVMPSSHLILCRPLLFLPSIFPSIRVFPMSKFFASGGQSIGVSASASVLPLNIQDWFPLEWTG